MAFREFATVQGGVFAQDTLTNPRNVGKPFGVEIKAFYETVVNHQPSPCHGRRRSK